MQHQSISSAAWSHDHGNAADRDYDAFLARVRARFTANLAGGARPLFTTDVGNLWEIYLGTFTDPVERQHHNCNACRHFIERFGGLVVIDANGLQDPAVWAPEDASEQYRPALAAMHAAVKKASVTGVFLSDVAKLGEAKTGVWHHLAVELPKSMVHRGPVLTAGQAMAEKRENFGIMSRSLVEFTPAMLDTALGLLRGEALYRSEKVLGQAEFLKTVQTQMDAAGKNKKARDNVLWLAVALASNGMCHPRSSMIGTLLEDLAAGMAFGDVKARFAAKMNPLNYQRPQAAPAAGKIAQAEKIVEQLGLAPALRRRFATVDDLQEALWKPAASKNAAPAGGVFGHLKPKADTPSAMRADGATMTLAKFAAKVLPAAEKIELLVPGNGSFCALVTACDADAAPLLQWDREEARNPVSWYVYPSGSSAYQWGLSALNWAPVLAITHMPHMWNGCDHKQFAPGSLFVLEGCADTREGGLALFPEILRGELHGIRSTIEAYSRDGTMERPEGQYASGILMDSRSPPCRVRVTSANGTLVTPYTIDRFE